MTISPATASRWLFGASVAWYVVSLIPPVTRHDEGAILLALWAILFALWERRP